MMNACDRLYNLLHYISLYIYYTTQYTDGINWLWCLMYSTPVALVDQGDCCSRTDNINKISTEEGVFLQGEY